MRPIAEIQKLKQIVKNLTEIDYIPVLVGGKALALLGSPRVTFDTDIVTHKIKDLASAKLLTNAMHKADLYYVNKLDESGTPIGWIDAPNVAASRIIIDKPATLFFWNPDIEMKIDILLDFPIKASELLATAEDKMLDKTTTIKVASLKSLKTMKEIAFKDRKKSKDLQDLEFIKGLMKSKSRGIEL
ncbi:MAG: hypothetical protein U9Q34_00525 [Elusimicrobiota bacterium]|nr:hypothetical protein [Elusimicrobiota bacterium]